MLIDILNKQERIKELIPLLIEYDKAYSIGKPLISDKEYDKLYFELAELEKETNTVYPNSPTQSIGYETIEQITKVKHNHPMLSLDKTKDWQQFIRYFAPGKDVVGMLKMDGMTCSLRYLNGELISAESRGNGEVGNNILHHVKVMSNVPKVINYQGELIIDGEIICNYDNFKKYEGEFANPRNLVAGSMNLLNSEESATRGFQFVAWYVVNSPKGTLIDTFNFLWELGFEVVPWTSSFDWDAPEYLQDRAKESGYPIDGLVGRYNDLAYGDALGATAHHVMSAYAFKFYDNQIETELIDIEWGLGRTGQVTPVAIFKPIEIEGSIVERASLHNISIAQLTLNTTHNYIGWKGQKVSVCKRNMIIPQIEEAELDNEATKEYFTIPTHCPVCGQPLTIIKETDTEILICINEECDGQLINKLVHYTSKKGLDIKGLSKATLAKLVEWDWLNSYADFYKLWWHREEWINKPGFGIISVDKILSAIADSARNTDETAFLSAIGIPFIGTTLAKQIIPLMPYDEFRDRAKDGEDFTYIEGIAEEKQKAIINYDFSEADAARSYITFAPRAERTEQAVAANLTGLTFCITGTLNTFANRAELTDLIASLGGKVSSSVSRKTTALINNDITSTSGKNKTAKELDVRIITEEDFKQEFIDFKK